MSKQPTISTISSGFYSTSVLNTNFENIKDQFNNTLSLDGSTPNAMGGDLDLNSNNLINGGAGYFNTLYLNGQVTGTLGTAFTWKGAWTTATSYLAYDVVYDNGNSYLALEDHTSGGTFSVDLASDKWVLLAKKGDAGAGTGDMLAANNLSDLTNTATALGNLGLTATVTELNYTSGVTSSIQTQLNNKQSLDATLTALAGLSTGANKIPYSTGTDTFGQLDFVDEDDMVSNSATSIPSQQSVKAYVDNEVATVSPSSMTLLDTVSTLSGSTVTSSGLDFSGYTKLEIYYDDVSVSAAAGTSFLNMKFGAGSYFQVTTNIAASAGNTLNGVTTVHLNNGTYASVTAENDSAIAVSHAGSFGDVSSETSITWDWDASQTFDSGQILIYGVK